MCPELSPSERKLLDAMEKSMTVKEAAEKAGLNPKYANQYTERIRWKRRDAISFLRDLATREKRSKLIAKILQERR